MLTMVERTVVSELEEALRARGSSIDQWRVLSLLVDRGGCPMHLVAEHAMLLAPKLSKLVDRMVSANLVLRRPDEHDRRRVLIAATARGRLAVAEWDEAAADVQERFRATLGPDVEAFDGLLRRVCRGLGVIGPTASAG